MRLLPFVLVITLLLLLPQMTFGWGGAGHMVIAAEAYQNLSPELKAEVFAVLQSHPDFEKWKKAYQPNANFELAAYVFMRASTWPDEIRRHGNQYDHPNWHFVDYPLRPPDFPLEAGPKPSDDVLYGIAQSEAVLSDTNANPELRAASLSWLIHLIGDLHQPLHCASLFTEAYPMGDKGGNDFFVRPNHAGVRLHGVWDGLLGSANNPRTAWNYAIELDAKFPKKSLPELTKHITPKDWSLESRQMAIDKGYLRGDLKGSTEADTAPPLPGSYTKEAKIVAEKQGSLAGYRLADDIAKFLKMGFPVPLLIANTNRITQTTVPNKVGALEASKYYNETLTVTGKVAQVTVRPKVTFINLDESGPSSPFTAVIFEGNMSQFGNVQTLKGKNVEISGAVTEYHNKPEIILESTNQVKVLISP